MQYSFTQLFDKMQVLLFLFLCVSAGYSLTPIDEIPERGTRIIGGDAAGAANFPWQAAIYLESDTGKFFCGGVLISQQWILTAAQCVNGVKLFTVHLGSHTLSTPDDNRVILATSTYVIHPDYNQNTLENDLGLIKLHIPITYTQYIQNITIVSAGQVNDDSGHGIMAGFGQTSDSAAGLNEELHSVTLTTIPNAECQITYGSQIKPGMLCAVGNFNEGICIGDTGGPLITYFVRYPIVYAIASFISGNGCESVDPSGYTRLDYYLDWIEEVISAP